MVRNTRLALACGLLTVATVAVLGTRATPAPRPDAVGLLPLPFAAGYALLRSEGWMDAPAPAATAVPHADAAMPSLEGHRAPRGPREGRDATARSER